VPAIGHPAEEHRVFVGLVPEFRRATEHHLAARNQHLVPAVDAQQQRVLPAGDRGIDVGTQRVGAVGADPGQQRDIAQGEIAHCGGYRSTSALRM
jgi:hypothetical protein